MRSSLLFASLILLLATVHGRLEMQLHGALHKKEEIPSDLELQRPPPSAAASSGGLPANTLSRPSERHLTSTARAAAEEDGVKKTMAPRLINEDYAGPSGHSPNHHRTIRCGPC